ncbi:hypothetical protein PHMEG_0004393 [Phytophthora megakarya]|uniref:Phytanoyl-CoA dioxygenase n=1 Tax=Phytophthora megakarya TaxID=4795 RepID=A0A225WW45_9STRA|nr:hypothetical protein PHMEG_0004393 [Phytophthora megakarya]
MRSRGGGIEYAPHHDYTKEAITDVLSAYSGSVHCGLIIASIPGTRLKVFAGCFTTMDVTKVKVLELRTGDAVLFRADLIHCGMAYDDDNYRLHGYVTVPVPAFEPDGVAGVDEKVFTCQCCGFQDTVFSAVRQTRSTVARIQSNVRGPRRKVQGSAHSAVKHLLVPVAIAITDSDTRTA